MRQTDLRRRSLAGMIGGGTWEGAPMPGMRRREFITLLGGAAVWPLAARAQQPAMPVIGFLGLSSPDAFSGRLAAFKNGLAAAGFSENRNVEVIYRWAHDEAVRLPRLAADLVNRNVNVIATTGGPASAFAAKTATSSIPIVFATSGSDPIELGLVASMKSAGRQHHGSWISGQHNLGKAARAAARDGA